MYDDGFEQMKHDLVDKYGYEEEEVEEMTNSEIKQAIDEFTDTSWAHPCESYQEFMEHEDF